MQLGYNEFGCNELGYNELDYIDLGYNEHSDENSYDEQIFNPIGQFLNKLITPLFLTPVVRNQNDQP